MIISYSEHMKIGTIRTQFPLLKRRKKLAYLDSAASTLTPQCVLDKMGEYYTDYGVNVARGIYTIADRATEEYENARAEVAQFIGAQPEEIIFTSGATMSMNMIALGIAHTVNNKSNIVVTAADHHSSIVPFQQLLQSYGNVENLRVVPLANDYTISIDAIIENIDRHTAIVVLPHVSNVLGTVLPIADIVTAIRYKYPNVIIVIDAAQSIAHQPIDVARMGCDFLVASGHKMYGPTGVGILYGMREKLENLTPLTTGGGMVNHVTAQHVDFLPLPQRLEAGTPPIAEAIGLGEAVRLITRIGMEDIMAHDHDLVTYARTQLARTLGDAITVYTPSAHYSNIIAFSLDGVHPHDIAQILNDQYDVAIRAGQHCAQILHRDELHISASARASFGIYNTRADIDRLVAGVYEAYKIFTR
jgi:cysteine desulfurase/selenocysteine lyase